MEDFCPLSNCQCCLVAFNPGTFFIINNSLEEPALATKTEVSGFLPDSAMEWSAAFPTDIRDSRGVCLIKALKLFAHAATSLSTMLSPMTWTN